jgi:hypothetical protein
VQYKYLKPSIAIDPFFEEPWMTKCVQTVALLLAARHPEADQIIYHLLDRADFHTTFAVLERAFNFIGRNDLEELFQVSKSTDRFQVMLDRARRKHGPLADLLRAVFDEMSRQADITKRRAMIQDADHRFFLALLLNVPERAKILSLVKQRFPNEEPIELVVDWVRELVKIKIFGSAEPNVLGIKAIDDAYLEVLFGLLADLSDDKISALVASATNSPQSRINELIASIKSLPMFKPMFDGRHQTDGAG